MRSIDVVTLRRLTSKVAEIQTSNRTRGVLRAFWQSLLQILDPLTHLGFPHGGVSGISSRRPTTNCGRLDSSGVLRDSTC